MATFFSNCLLLFKVDVLVSDTETAAAGGVQRGHCRSQSDGTVMAEAQDSTDMAGRKDIPDKKSMKAILTQLLSSTQGMTPIQVRLQRLRRQLAS